MDQGDIGSCVGHAWAGVLRWHVKRWGGTDCPLSRLQIYYNARVLERTVKSDAGCEIRNAVKAIKSKGVANEEWWPYVEEKFDDEPRVDVRNVRDWSGLAYERVPVGTITVKRALADGNPVVVGLTLFESFESEDVERTGVVPVPDIENENMVGGHAMYCVGYGQKKGHFTIVNSWGSEWGDRGYCYIPEKYVGSTMFGGDYWIAKYSGGF